MHFSVVVFLRQFLDCNSRERLLDCIQQILIILGILIDAQLPQLLHVTGKVILTQRLVRRRQRNIGQSVRQLPADIRQVVMEAVTLVPQQLVGLRVLSGRHLELSDVRAQI